MKVGVIARSEDRGLGIQTHEVCRHLNPDRVLLIEPTGYANFPQHPERYDDWDTTTVPWPRKDDTLPEDLMRHWLDGLDVVYTAETLYDWRIPSWFSGAVVCHANPEMLRPDRRTAPVTWWTATPWLIDEMPPGTRVVPMPCPTDRFPAYERRPGPVRFLHVAGHGAMCDRNGTALVGQAAAQYRGHTAALAVTHQDDVIPKVRGNGRIEVTKIGAVHHWWEMYYGADVLVMPRRFGGLCLPVIEALAAGLVVLMTDCSPNQVWPGPRVPVWQTEMVRTVGGHIPVASCDSGHLADAMAVLADPDSSALAEHRDAAAEWVAGHSWEALEPMWRDELERACR